MTDALNFRIRAERDPRFKTFGAAGDNPAISPGQGVAVDSDGHVYVVDALFDNVQISTATAAAAFGSPGAAAGELWLPNAISIDSQYRIYISDTYNQRIQVFQYLRAAGGRP